MAECTPSQLEETLMYAWVLNPVAWIFPHKTSSVSPTYSSYLHQPKLNIIWQSLWNNEFTNQKQCKYQAVRIFNEI